MIFLKRTNLAKIFYCQKPYFEHDCDKSKVQQILFFLKNPPTQNHSGPIQKRPLGLREWVSQILTVYEAVFG
jgi:hypothetical protein